MRYLAHEKNMPLPLYKSFNRKSVVSTANTVAVATLTTLMCAGSLRAAEQCEFAISDQTSRIWLTDVTGLSNVNRELLEIQLLKRVPFVTCKWNASEMDQAKRRLNSYTPRSILRAAWTKESSEVNRLAISALANDKAQVNPSLPEEIVGDPYSGHDHFTMVAAAKDIAVSCTQPSAFQHSGWGSYWPEKDGNLKDFSLSYVQHPSGNYVTLKERTGKETTGYGFEYLDDNRNVVNDAIPSSRDNDKTFVADCGIKKLVTFSRQLEASIQDRELLGVVKKYVSLKIIRSLRSGTPAYSF